MRKEGVIDTAIGRLRIAQNEAQEKAALADVWEDGRIQGQIDVDAKLDTTLTDIKRGNDELERCVAKLSRACEERDIFLAQFTRAAHKQAIEGLLAAGFHPPAVHSNPQHQARVGRVKCRMCNSNIVVWDALTDDIKKAKMTLTYQATMKARAESMLTAGVMSKTSPTIHQIAGVAKPEKPEDPEVKS